MARGCISRHLGLYGVRASRARVWLWSKGAVSVTKAAGEGKDSVADQRRARELRVRQGTCNECLPGRPSIS